MVYLTSQVNSIYFYLEKGQEKCFKDEVVKNYVSSFEYFIVLICFIIYVDFRNGNQHSWQRYYRLLR